MLQVDNHVLYGFEKFAYMCRNARHILFFFFFDERRLYMVVPPENVTPDNCWPPLCPSYLAVLICAKKKKFFLLQTEPR